MISRISFLLLSATVLSHADLIPGTTRQIFTGASNNGYPDFVAGPFRANTVSGTLKMANLFGSTVTLNGGLVLEGCSTAGLPWLTLTNPLTANSTPVVAFSGTSDATTRNAIGNTGFHNPAGWSLRFTGLTAGSRYRVQLLNVEGFAVGPAGRVFDISVDGALAFDDFNPPGRGEAPFAGIAQFEAEADDAGSILVSLTAGSAAVAPDQNPYLGAVAIAEVNTETMTGITAGLVGHWRFDESAGTTATNSFGPSADGTLNNFGGTQWVPGLIGGALEFDGLNDWVQVATYGIPTTHMTLAMWVWADSRPVWASFAKNWGSSVNSQFHFGLNDTQGDMSTYSAGNLSGFGPAREGVLFPLGSWQHVAMVADGTSVRVYRNGQRVGTTFNYTGVLYQLIVPFAFGVKTNNTGTAPDPGVPGYWDGKMDDAGLWVRALSDAEILNIYTTGLNGQSLSNAVPTAPPPGIVSINEFLAVNSGGLADEDGDTPDWIEIYNGLDVPQNMDGWKLRDSAAEWTFPATVIPPRSFLVVFASNKNRAVAGSQLHTNFQLSSSGEYLALVNAAGTVVSSFTPEYSTQLSNISYGMSRPVTDTEPDNSAAYNDLKRYFKVPTPGKSNLGGTAVLGPNISNLTHTPALPVDADNIIVTARVSQTFAPVGTVTMNYRVNYGAEIGVTMADDGAHGDGTAGDGIFGATIPATASTPGQMVRYYVVAADNLARTTREPLFLEPTTTPEYQGTVIANPAVTTPLPQLQWFVQTPSLAETDPGTQCSVFYLGEFYDNVDVRIRGGTARSWPKKSYKLKFNDGYHFRFRPLESRVDEINLNATYTDKSYVRAVLTYGALRDAGIPTPEHFHVHVRQNGAFYSVALMAEQIQGDFLERWGIDRDGALYKGGPGSTYDTVTSFEKKNRESEGTTDVQAHLSNLTLSGTALETYVFDNVDIPAMVNYMAGMSVSQDIDGTDKNHFLYRDTEHTREWRMLPYDIDLTFGPNALNTDTMVYNQQNVASPACASHPFIGVRPYLLHGGKYNRFLESIVNTPRTRTMLLRRLRSLTDTQLATTYFQTRIDSFVTLLGADVAADRSKWGGSAHFGGTVYSLVQATDRIKNEYLAAPLRVAFLSGNTIAGVLGDNPSSQPVTPPPTINFGSINFFPPTNQAEEYFTLVNPNAFAVDLTGWSITGEVSWTFRPGTVLLAGETIYLTPNAIAFRSRTTSPKGAERLFVQGNYTGQLSARGGALTLVAPGQVTVASTTYPGTPTAAQQSLRVTEVNFNPTPGGAFQQRDYEFIEFKNIGASPLTLTGIRIAGGVDFTFPAMTLNPGSYTLVASNSAALTSRYGAGLPIAGTFTGHLDEEGNDERIHVIDPSGENVLDFEYDPGWQPAADGGGFSLTVVDENALHTAWDLPAQWRVSGRLHGTPGASDSIADTDSDGMTDGFEGTYLFNPTNPADALQDADGDGQSNAAEAQAGTNPRDPGSTFRITEITAAAAGGVTLKFPALAGRTYAIQRTANLTLPGGGWTFIHTEPAGNARTIEFTDNPGGPKHFYRAVTPAP